MAGKPIRQTSPKKKSAAASETSESIAEQTRRFLKSGNKIEVVESGLSGQPVLGAGDQSGPAVMSPPLPETASKPRG